MHSTDQPLPISIKKFTGLPIERGGHMRAAVEIRHHPPLKAHRKSRHLVAIFEHLEHMPRTALGKRI